MLIAVVRVVRRVGIKYTRRHARRVGDFPAAVAVAMIVTVVLAPLASEPRLQTTTLPDAAQPVEADTKVTPDGKASVSVTLVAVDGPRFATTIVYVRLLFTTVGSGDTLLLMARSAAGLIVSE